MRQLVLRPILLFFFLACLAVLPASCSDSGEAPRVVPQVDPVKPRRALYSPARDDRLLVLDADGGVGIWDLSRPARLFATLRARAIDAAFSPDGRHVATVSLDGQVRWWAVDGDLVWASETGHPGPARAVAVSADLIVSGGEDGTLRFWRLDGTPLGGALKAHDGAIVAVDLSRRGDLVSLGGDEAVRLWKKGRQADGSEVPVYEPAVLFRPEKRRFESNFLRLLRLDDTWGWDHSVEFSPSGEFVVAALYDRSIRIWNGKGSPTVVEKAHSDRPVRSLCFSPRGDVIASAGFDGAIRLWDLNGRPAATPINAHQGPAYSVSFSPDGKSLVSTGRDDRVRGWHRDGRPAYSLPAGRPRQISTLAVPPQGALLVVADQEGGVSTLGFDGQLQARLERDGTRPVDALAFAPDGQTVVGGGADGLVWSWGLDGKPRGSALKANGRVSALAFDPAGQTLAVGTRPFQLWRQNLRLWQRPLRSVDEVTSIAFAPSADFIVTGSLLGDLHVWDRDGNSRAHRPKQGIEVVGSLVMSPGGDSFMAAFGTRQTVVREFGFDLSPRGEPFGGHLGGITGLAFAPDGRFVSGGEDGAVRLWTLPSRKVETIAVGLPIDQLGFWRGLLWVRAGGEWLYFYETNGALVASLLLDRNAITFTPGGWYSATSPPSRRIHVYDASGALMSPSQVSARRSPERVMSAIVDRAGGKAAIQ